MSYTGKNYLDLTGLTTYDGLIKEHIRTEDAKAIKFAKLSSDGNNLLLYKSDTANAQTAENSADFTIPMGSAALKSLITSLGTAVGATPDSAQDPTSYSAPTFTGDIASATSIANACQLLDTHIGTLASLTTTDKTNIVTAINEIVSAIAGLDVDEFALATVNNNVVTIKGIKEVDGKIGVGTDNTKDVVLEEVAITGAAEDVSTAAITDGDAENPETLYTAGDVQSTLENIARDLNNLTEESAVTVEKQTTADSGYAATYIIKQNNVQVGDKINIPLDFLVKNATIETVTVADEPYTGAEVGDKYIDFVINVKVGTATDEHIYIPVNDLVHPISGGTTTVTSEYELQVSVSTTNEITATLNNIYAKKVQYVPTSQTTILTNVTTVEGALNKIDELIQGMDADLDATSMTPADVGGTAPLAVVTGVTEVDGEVTGVDSGDADPFGAAAGVYNAIGSIATSSIEALFPTT